MTRSPTVLALTGSACADDVYRASCADPLWVVGHRWCEYIHPPQRSEDRADLDHARERFVEETRMGAG
ncbi:hypothetical protein DK389_19770 [Methylobacterium durans]|uniref:Uncharacterized protein n=1 Tax=Methylobacterium durans TaxID=2202825 RepID=A0A2U8WAI5_9HYPH|nr:hypothetical protein DK389_19770 [Methylobacterium durans]